MWQEYNLKLFKPQLEILDTNVLLLDGNGATVWKQTSIERKGFHSHVNSVNSEGHNSKITVSCRGKYR